MTAAISSSSPNKRQRTASLTFESQHDFVPLTANGNDGNTPSTTPFRPRFRDRREAHDKPKSKHVLPGCEPWVLVKTKLHRRFVHNTQSKESFWRIPPEILPAVKEFERYEEEQKEKAENAKWAEDQLRQMREQARPVVDDAANNRGHDRRRRSESLQREDEALMMAEIAAQVERDDEHDAEQIAGSVRTIQPQGASAASGYASDSSYEEVEVTDSEGEEEQRVATTSDVTAQDIAKSQGTEAPVEFGEDDIAYQLAAMGEEYGLDAGEYGDEPEEGWEEGDEGLPLTDEDAANLFRDLLDDYRISPFTPWEKLILDQSENSILNDDRYTVLNSMKARKDVFDAWAKDKAAQIKAQRAEMNKLDPKIPYLAFLQEKATPKLYWPEFKRKYKREAEMNDRKLTDKDREKLYRDHINRLKLPESTRKADLQSLLESIPGEILNRNTSLDSLPQELLSKIQFVSLSPEVRTPLIESYIRKVPPP
jgi:hypothetical protein